MQLLLPRGSGGGRGIFVTGRGGLNEVWPGVDETSRNGIRWSVMSGGDATMISEKVAAAQLGTVAGNRLEKG